MAFNQNKIFFNPNSFKGGLILGILTDLILEFTTSPENMRDNLLDLGPYDFMDYLIGLKSSPEGMYNFCWQVYCFQKTNNVCDTTSIDKKREFAINSIIDHLEKFTEAPRPGYDIRRDGTSIKPIPVRPVEN
jgi:hypothetical protein